MKKLRQLVVYASLLVVASCSSDDTITNTGTLNYAYYPVNVGHEQIYDATLIVKDPIAGSDTSVFQIKEVIESEFTDNQGRLTQRLERYTRPTSSDPWVIADVWTANMTPTRVERKEENVTYIKLIFPIATNKTWDGNSLNIYDSREYSYEWADDTYTMNGISYDSTLQVLQIDEDNFVYKEYAEEVYGVGIGLIYKNQTYIEKDYSNPQFVGIKSQRIYTEKLVSYSN